MVSLENASLQNLEFTGWYQKFHPIGTNNLKLPLKKLEEKREYKKNKFKAELVTGSQGRYLQGKDNLGRFVMTDPLQIFENAGNINDLQNKEIKLFKFYVENKNRPPQFYKGKIDLKKNNQIIFKGRYSTNSCPLEGTWQLKTQLKA